MAEHSQAYITGYHMGHNQYGFQDFIMSEDRKEFLAGMKQYARDNRQRRKQLKKKLKRG